MKLTIDEALKKLYENEINCSIHSEWDAGWTAKIGDHMNGYMDIAYFLPNEIDQIGEWLINAANRLHPFMVPITITNDSEDL
jgi:hypothetical protein